MEEKPKRDDVSGLIQDARELIAEDMDAEAVLRLKSVLRKSPDNIEALLLYARVSPSKANAKKTIDRIMSIDPYNTEARLLLKRIEREEDLTQKSKQSSAMPTINIVNDNSNSVVAESSATNIGMGGGAYVEQGNNKLAFWVGLIGALFAVYGLGYMINGKVLLGLLYLFILGPIFVFIVLAIGAGGEAALLCALPLYVIGAWQHAKAGSKRDPKLIPVSFGKFG